MRRPVPHPRVQLRLEALEDRRPPAATWQVESFDPPPGGVPSGWQQWSASDPNAFAISTVRAFSGTAAFAATGGSGAIARAWQSAPTPADFGARATVWLGSLEPVQILARGTNLDGPSPSYVAVSVTRGMQVQLVRVVNGAATVLASQSSTTYLSNVWAQVSLQPHGDSWTVRVRRTDTAQYLSPTGAWQDAPIDALSVLDPAVRGPGQVGLDRTPVYADTTYTDDFTVLGSAPSLETFDQTSVAALPAGWTQWGHNGSPGFADSTVRSASAPGALASTGASNFTGRAWINAPQPADVQLSSALYLDSIIPAGILARGSNLDTLTPSFYAVSATRGPDLQLLRVVDGVPTVLGNLSGPGYLSGQWVRIGLMTQGDTVSAALFRGDTNQYLNAAGQWQSAPAWALTVTDSTIAGGGQVGLYRPASYAGTVSFDDFTIGAAASAPTVSLSGPALDGPVSGPTTVQADVTDNLGVARVEFWLDGGLRATDTTLPYSWSFDSGTLPDGPHALLVKAIDTAGNVGQESATLTTTTADVPAGQPTVPQHYSHIRIAELAYNGTPIDSFAQNLLKNSVDLVVPNPRYLGTIDAVAPATPQLIYSNFSNVYSDLLLDWLAYADRTGTNREAAFYHAAQAQSFTGDSASSQPVNRFWDVARGGTPLVNLTSAARGTATGGVTFGAAGESLYLGYPEKFREINVNNLTRSAGNGWSGQWEYASAVDAAGNPIGWKPLTLVSDGTAGLTRSGRITFDPPADWQTTKLSTGPGRLFYVRFHTLMAGTAPTAKTILGRDFVNANATTHGTIPAFDASADANHDGYLNDAEYARRRTGLDARFVYESRIFYPYYGQFRYVVNPAPAAVRAWAVDFSQRYLAANPLADGLFVDNSNGKYPLGSAPVVETTAATYTADYAALLGAVKQAVAPKWLLANTVGGGTAADAVAQVVPWFEEYTLRPLTNYWSQVEDLAATVKRRLALSSPSNFAVIDSLPAGGSPTDARTQLATLAYYYLLADPTSTFLMFYGGSAPSSSWTQHWSPAAAFNVGQPAGGMSVRLTGDDPANTRLTYKVYQRSYGNALVLYKPLSYTRGVGTGTTANATATTVPLGGTYRPLKADGTLGAPVTSVSLRNGEGAILVKD